MTVYWPAKPGFDAGYCRGRRLSGFGESFVVEAIVPLTGAVPDNCIGTYNAASYPQYPVTVTGSCAFIHEIPATLCRFANERALRLALQLDDTPSSPSVAIDHMSALWAHVKCSTSSTHGPKLLLFDIACGLFARHLTLHVSAAAFLHEYSLSVTEYGSDLVHFLMGAPADLKLNNTATAFYGSIVLFILDGIEQFRLVLLSTPQLEQLLAVLLCCGLITTAAGIVDLMRLLAGPLLLVQRGNRRLWKSTRVLNRLFLRLFRGKKYNILRQRYDSVDTDYMQGALCAYLFAILAFLVPTLVVTRVLFILAYYAIFIATIPPRMISSLRHVDLIRRPVTLMNVHSTSPAVVDLQVKENIDWGRVFSSWFHATLPIKQW